MKTIYKYQLDITDRQIISMPRYHDFLDIQNQNNKPTIWIEVDTEDQEMADEVFFLVGTGLELPNEANYYIGSVQVKTFVWHIYQKIF